MLLDLKNLSKKYSINPSGIIHIGAHTGEEISLYEGLFKKDIEKHLFEPQQRLFKILSDKYYDTKNINLYNYACGEETGELLMNISSNDGASSSILEPKIHLEIHPDVEFNNKEVIKIKQLDKFNIHNSDFLNIDVQGYELNVLKGGKETLSRIKYIVLEINRDEVYKDVALVEEIDSFLNVHNFLRVSTKYAYDTLPWGDALYIKKDFLTKKQKLYSYIKIFIYKRKVLYMLYILIRKIIWNFYYLLTTK
jgi:FkbM family methyltransferase|tara:strand:+ start:52 stop:804 length:753 start_codon:yes stop_codon:yes gene_type:complete